MSKGKSPEDMSVEELKAKALSVDLERMVNESINQAKLMLKDDCLHPYIVVYGYVEKAKQWGNAVFPIMMSITPDTMVGIFRGVGKVCSEQGIYPFGVSFACKGKCLSTKKDLLPKDGVVDYVLKHGETKDIMLISSVSIDNRNHAASAEFSDDVGSLGEFEHSNGDEVLSNPCGEVFVGYAMARAASKLTEMAKSGASGEPKKRSSIPKPSMN